MLDFQVNTTNAANPANLCVFFCATNQDLEAAKKEIAELKTALAEKVNGIYPEAVLCWQAQMVDKFFPILRPKHPSDGVGEVPRCM